ncbi:MAG: T9SS type A sorting domain-containing protein [Bacteroidales bacterium]|nr:MAG: T9SS type A sorting domain-containing protein [Bacteroidales bacterium]
MRKKLNIKLLCKVSLFTIICAFLFSFSSKAQELVTGGNMEDSSAWNFYWGTNGPDSAGTYEFNHVADGPAAGAGGCYMVSSYGQSASFLWQPVTITPGHKYLITGAYKNASVDSTQNTWVELFITRVKPAGGEMTTDIGYELNTWMEPEILNFDGTFHDDFRLANTATKEIFIPDTVTQTEWYLVLKAGCWNNLSDPDPTFILLFDEISLTDLGVKETIFPIETIVFGAVDNAEDFTGTVNLSWDADSVYLKFEIVDDSIVNTGNSWQVDNIEIYFDMDNSKNIHWPRNQEWQQAVDEAYDDNDYQLRLVPDVPFATNNTARPGGTSIVAGSENQIYERTAEGYEFMLNVAWDSLLLGFNAAVGTEIGFDVLHSDNDAVASDANRNQITFNSPTEFPYNDPCLFGTLQLRSNGTFMRVLDTENPTVPDNLAASVDQNGVVLTWDASSDNIVVHQYIVRQGSSAIDTILAKQSDNTYTVPDLAAGDYEFRLRALDVYENMSGWTPTIDVTVTSVDENTVSSLKLYPNPANNVINISSEESIENVTITDIIGQEVMKINVNASSTQIMVQDLSSGVYFLTVKLNSGSSVNRIIVE